MRQSNNAIAGLKKMKMMTPESQDSRVWEFSREALKVRMGPLGLCVGTCGPLECSGEFLKPSWPFWLSLKPFCTRIM